MMRALDGPTKGVAKRARLHEIGHRHGQPDHRFRGTLVSELRSLIALQSAAMSCSRPAAIMLESGPGQFSTTLFRRPVPVLECVANVTLRSDSRQSAVNNGNKRVCTFDPNGISLAHEKGHTTLRDGGAGEPNGGEVGALRDRFDARRRHCRRRLRPGRQHGSPEVKTSLQQRTLTQPRPRCVTADAEGKKLWKLTQQFYERRQHAPAWINGLCAASVAELIAALNAASDEGLDPQRTTSRCSSRSARPLELPVEEGIRAGRSRRARRLADLPFT